MKTKLLPFLVTITFILSGIFPSFGQLSGIKNIPGDYPSIVSAVAAVNGAVIGAGGVTFNIPANYTETISTFISLTATGTAANPVIFQKDPSTTGANPLITAYTTGVGTPSTAVQDGIWRLIGSDYITINGIDVRDNASNANPATMEYGYALYKASATDGCQHVTIQNCTITLNRANNATGTAPMTDGSAGIILMNALATSATINLSATTSNGSNSYNRFYSNTIQNCNIGISMIGYQPASDFTLADNNNDIGGSSAATGNTIVNFGGATGATNAAAGIRTLAQYGLNVSYNTINSNNGGGINHANILRGIYINTAKSANAIISFNAVTVKGGGTTQQLTGIENASGSTAAANTVAINNNTVTNCTYTTATTGNFYGIYNSATPAGVTINTNTISNNSSAATSAVNTTGLFYEINNAGAASAVTINSNVLTGNSTATSVGTFTAIYNGGSTPVLNINSNTIAGDSTATVTGARYSIYNYGGIITTENINANNIGTALLPAIKFTAANALAQSFIYNYKGTSTSALSISNNNFYNIVYVTATAATNTYILNSYATRSQAINGNTFNNMNVNSLGSATFISNSVIVSATGTQNVNNNAIVGTYTKTAGGTITLFTSTVASVAGSIINNNNNNFSNITLTGATVMAGWVNTDAGASTKTIQNNTLSNWTVGTGAVNAMNVNIISINNAITGNIINNISGGASVTGITTAAGNDKIFANTINTLSTTGISVVTGILVTAGTNKNIYGNKIYDLSANNASATINGITVSGTTVVMVNIFNNLIGDLRSPIANSSTDLIRGINLTATAVNSTLNVYYNTIYLNATSSGATFSTSGIYHVTSTTATTGTLNLRNNIITNTSTPSGAGLSVAFRINTTTLTNYGATSNNNLFYAGVPSATRLLFYDGVNIVQFITNYRVLVTSRDSLSVTEDLIGTSKFISLVGSSASFLHLDPSKSTQAESGAANITGFSTDYDAQTRQGNAGYSGTGTAPDIGADEIAGTASVVLTGTVAVGTGQTFTSLTGTGGLFATINSLGLSGNLTVNITSDLTEDGTNVLYQWAEKGVGNYSLTIQPDASTPRLISGNVLAGMIRFNGAKRVTIDGSNGTINNYLTFRNTNTPVATGTAFTFINAAAGITIKYCNIEAAANATSGVILFSTSTPVGGNSNNIIRNCSINGTVSAVSGNICIYSAGTVGNENTNNSFTNNKIFNYRDRALDITATGSKSWIITGNSCYNGDVSGTSYAASSTLHGIRVLGGFGYTISGNYIGGNAPLAAGTAASYSSAGILSFQGILLTTSSATPVSLITGNTVANLSFNVVPNVAASANVFIGIETNGSGINIGGPLATDGNMIGSNSANGSIAITTTTSSNTYLSLIKGINCNSTGGLVSANQVGGIDVNNIGTSPGASSFYGIYINNATAPSQVNNNIIGSLGTGAAANSIRVLSTSTAAATFIAGINIGPSVTSPVQVDGNTIKNISFLSSVTATIFPGGLTGIYSGAAAGAAVTITNNTITQDSIANYTNGSFLGIYNFGAAATVSINNNTIAGNNSNSASGVYNAIYNGGAVTGAININFNNIGNSGTNAINFYTANSGSQIFVSNVGGASTAALSISNNNFQGINYSVAGTGNSTFISNTAATLSQTINGNTFTNLNVNSIGSITFITDNVALAATGVQNVNNNAIVTAFTKKAGGTITLFTSSANSAAGSVINNNNNNFSNITAPAATNILGWINTDGGSPTKTIQNNTFTNWTSGTGTITAISLNISGTTNYTTGNIINNLAAGGAVTGITASGNENIFSNTINTLSTSGAFAVTAISIPAGATKNIYKNKMYDLSGSSAGSTVNGILVSGGTTANISNNLIGDLRTPAGNASDPIRGISITSTLSPSNINVYYNTIYLNASSTGALFGTTGIYQAANATSTIAALDLRNNLITNTSTIKGGGYTVVFRRSAVALNNYASTSNNNLFYAGTAGVTNLLYWDAATGDYLLSNYKSRVSTRDALSVTENETGKFLSLTGGSAVFLHVSSLVASAIESAGANISGYMDDFDGQIRAGNTGYTGGSTLPDIGADEIFGVETVPPTISYTPLPNTTVITNNSLTSVTITDASGVNTAAGTKPRIYYKRSSDTNGLLDNTPSTNGWKYKEANNATSPFTFTIDYSLLSGGAAVTAGNIQYFVVAQDLATTANVAVNAGTFNAAPTSVALTSAAFPLTGSNSYNIAFAGTYNVGATEVFTSLTKADGLFASINNAGLMGNTTIVITSNLAEDGTNGLNQWTELNGSNYTLTIKPDAASLRSISGNVAAGLIRFNGPDRVTIDGSVGGSGKFLSFKNTNTAGTTGTVFSFLNGASNNTIRYTDAQGFADATDGVVLFSTSSVAGGNSNNLLDNCTINATVGVNSGNVAVYSAGTTGNENSSNTISNNNIYGYRDRGLDIASTGSTAWTISGNSFYNGTVSSVINYAASSTLHGIRVLGGSGYSILNNFLGGSAALCSGANAVYSSTLGNVSFQGILLNTGAATPASNIKGNTVAAISVSSLPGAANSNVFIGIEADGAGINIGGSSSADGNSIGSLAANGSIIVTTSTSSSFNTSIITGINCTSSGGVINNNTLAGWDLNNIGTGPASSFIQGIYASNASAPTQINNNIIGSASTSNSIRIMPASTSAAPALTGIVLGTAVNSAVQVNGNILQNISNLSATSSGSFTGIYNTSSLSGAVITFSSDTIQNINSGANASAGSTIYSGITSGSASTITNNLIDAITLSSTGINAQVTGVNISGGYASTVSGNIVSNLSTASTKSNANVETGSPAGSAIIGILNSTTAAGQIINNNRFSGFSATSNAGVNVVVTGIAMMSTGSGNIFNNRLGTMINLATGAAPALCHIVASSGSFNVYNNVLRIGNLTNTNALKIYGFIHASSTNWNYFHNSVKVTGNTGGPALRSAAFLLSGNSSPVLKDNIFFNIRTGTGANYAVSNLASPSSTWASTASDYNDFYSINPNTVAEWGNGVSKTFAQWQGLSGGDAHSINSAISFIITPYDLEPDSVSNCAFDNAGTPITTPVLINTDINSKPRNAVAPDLGAYEFGYKGFTVIAGSNSPICAGDSLYLTANPTNGISPHFSWRDPSNAVISNIQNPVLLATASGQYKVTVTDSTGCIETDSTLVTINQRPTAHITSATSLCDSGFVYINIAVTGIGTINGTLSNGDDFSGTAPLIIDTVFVTSTTAFNIISLSDSTCNSILSDIPDTITVNVTHLGDWLGITTNWHDAVNWCGGVVPTSSTNVTIPAGTPKMPLITDSVYCNSLTINPGDSVTVTSTGTLNIAGVLTNNGVYTDNGTTNFNGTSGQQTFSGVTTFNNMVLNNTNGLLLPIAIVVKNLTISKGILNANNFGITISGNWINSSSTTAFSAGTAIVTFSGTTAQSIGGIFATTFNNLAIASTGSTVTLNVNASISGTLSVSSGTFDLAVFTANHLTAGGTLSVVSNAFLKIGGTNTFPANYTTNSLGTGSTVEYSGTNQTVSNQVYGNLKLSSSSGAAVKTLPATSMTIVGNLSSIQGAGTSVSFTAASTIIVNGSVSIGASTTFNGSSYTQSIGGNWANNGTFNGNTGTVSFTGAGSVVNGTGVQNFNNLTIAASGVTFSAINIMLTGNLATTGSGSFVQASGGTLTMSGTGTTISGTGISLENLTVSGTVTTSIFLNLTGNLAVSGSFTAGVHPVTMSGVSKILSGSGSINFGVLSITGSVTTAANFSISSGLTVSGSFSASAGTVAFTGTSTLSGTANLYNATINGTSLQLSSASVMGIANTFTITSGSFDATTSSPNTVNFNGAGAQNVNAITYSNLILSNGNTKTAVGPATANDLTIETGTTFNPSTYTYSIYGSWFNKGTFTAGTSTIQFVGPANAYINGATTFNIITSNASSTSTALILQSNISAAIVNMTNGMLLTGPDTLTITNTRTGNGIIEGYIQRTHAFTTGVAYAFEGPDNTITFSSVSSVTTIIVFVAEGMIGDFPFGGSVSRVYNIAVPSGTYNATLRLHYEDDELNGNNESTMALWHYTGSSWAPVGKTSNSTTSNYVEQSGLTNITNRWTLSDNANLVQWNGSVSTDWNTAANWTVLQGSGSRPPSSTDIVDLGTATFTNQPTISNAVTVKNIIFGSVQAVTLSMASGGSLTSGDIHGTWISNATHTININNQSLTVNGNMDLSDGTNGHAINLNVVAGSITTLGSLSESGGANINFSGAGTLNVYQNFSYSNGTFTAGSGTVTYDGSENQVVANINYNNLTVNKTGGLAAINNTVNVSGNLLISSGELDNYSTSSIAGDVTINSGSTVNNYSIFHVQGNWNNNGTYIGTASSVYFDGTGTQNISATTFNNLYINKSSGTATLTGEIILKGDFIITAGTLDFQTYDVTRDVLGGTTSIADGATGIIGGNNGPANFQTIIIGVNSTIIYNGVNPQYISSDGITFGNVIFRNGGSNPKLLITSASIKGNLTIESGATVDASSYTINLYGNWINNGTFTPSTSTVIFSGISKSISGNTSFNQMTVSGTYSYQSNLSFSGLYTVTSTGIVTAGASTFLTVSGDFTNNGGNINDSGTITYTGTVLQTFRLINAVYKVANIYFNGSVSPVLNSSSGPIFGNVTINNTGGVTAVYKWTVNNSFTVGSGATWNGDTYTHDIYGNVTNNGTITSSGIFNFIPTSAVTVNLGTNFSSTGRVIFGGSGAMTMAGTPLSLHNVVISNTNSAGITPSSNWLITNNITVNSGSILNASGYTYFVGGKISNSGTINSGTSTFTLNGTVVQDIFTLSALNNLTVNKPSGVTTMSSDVPVNGVLNFISGSIQTGSNLLTQSLSGTITGAAQNTGWVNGNLQKSVATGSSVSRVFEIGDSNYYTPVSLLFSLVSISGNLTATTTPTEHPQIDSSGINKNLDVNRYWTLNNAGVGFTTAASTFNWVPSDVDAGANTVNFRVSLFDGSGWGLTNSASPTSTSIQATGLSHLGAFAIGEGFKLSQWTGAAGTANWFTATNWYGGVPSATVETLIPATLQGGRTFPVISTGTGSIDSVTIQNGGSLTIVNATLQVKGAIVNAGICDATAGTIEMNGTAPQTITANTFTDNSLFGLLINNNVTLAGQDTLTGTLTVGSSAKTFATGGFLNLRSTLSGTARVTPLPVDGTGAATSFIAGNVTVERFLPAKRAWRLLTSPLSNTGSIFNSWQNGGVYEAGKGMLITGPNPGAITGLDASQQNSISMKSFNAATQIYTGITNTKTTNLSNNSGATDNVGYFVFVRGDRDANNLNLAFNNATTLRSTGSLQTGKQAFTASPNYNTYTLMGNPFASPIDFNNILRTHLIKRFYAWDPTLNQTGAYVVMDDIDGDGVFSKSIPASLQDKNIQSGQAFFVLTDTAGPAALTYFESSKTSASGNAGFRVFGQTGSMNITLNLLAADSSTITADAVLAEYNNDFCACVNLQDAAKLNNTNETLSLMRDLSSLAIERRPVIIADDTLFLRLIQSSQTNYQFVFNASNLAVPGLTAVLEDSYTGIATPVATDGGTLFNFTINSDIASRSKDRFRVVFKQVAVLPVTYSDVKAWQQGKNIAVQWNVEDQLNIKQYEVEKSLNGRIFSKVATVAVTNNNRAAVYNWLDLNAVAGDNFYRIKNIGQDGVSAYSKVVTVHIEKLAGSIGIYPNPVEGNMINLQLNNMPAGKYIVRLITVLGQDILDKEITHAGGTITENIPLSNEMAKGTYDLEIIHPDKSKTTISIVKK